MTLAECIRQARQVYGMSQAELARRCGLSTQAMNKIEQGHTPDPCFSHVRRIAAALHLNLETLATDLAYPPARANCRRPLLTTP